MLVQQSELTLAKIPYTHNTNFGECSLVLALFNSPLVSGTIVLFQSFD